MSLDVACEATRAAAPSPHRSENGAPIFGEIHQTQNASIPRKAVQANPIGTSIDPGIRRKRAATAPVPMQNAANSPARPMACRTCSNSVIRSDVRQEGWRARHASTIWRIVSSRLTEMSHEG